MSKLSRFAKKNRKWLAPVATVATGGLAAPAMYGSAALTAGGGGAAAGGLGAGGGMGMGAGGPIPGGGNLGGRGSGGLGADFSGADLRQQQDFNTGLLTNAYNAIIQQLGQIQGPATQDYNALADQYGASLQAGLSQSGLASRYGPEYEANLKAQALRQGDVGSLAASKLATQSTAGRGGGFGGGGANQVRQASLESSMGTQQALLAGSAGAEQGRAGVAAQIAQLLAQGSQQQNETRMAGLAAQQQLAMGRLGTFGGLGGGLLGGLAKVSPEDTNKEFDNTLNLINTLSQAYKNVSGGGGSPGNKVS